MLQTSTKGVQVLALLDGDVPLGTVQVIKI